MDNDTSWLFFLWIMMVVMICTPQFSSTLATSLGFITASGGSSSDHRTTLELSNLAKTCQQNNEQYQEDLPLYGEYLNVANIWPFVSRKLEYGIESKLAIEFLTSYYSSEMLYSTL